MMKKTNAFKFQKKYGADCNMEGHHLVRMKTSDSNPGHGVLCLCV